MVHFDQQAAVGCVESARRAAMGANISKTHFTWRGEKSDDGKAWSEFVVVEAYRSEE